YIARRVDARVRRLQIIIDPNPGASVVFDVRRLQAHMLDVGRAADSRKNLINRDARPGVVADEIHDLLPVLPAYRDDLCVEMDLETVTRQRIGRSEERRVGKEGRSRWSAYN